MCGLFAENVVLAYPGGGNRGWNAVCDRMRGLFDDPAKKFTYSPPDIREVLVDGDLATVRLYWTLTVSDATGKPLETTRENGVDVFRRKPSGNWKIHISHAFSDT